MILSGYYKKIRQEFRCQRWNPAFIMKIVLNEHKSLVNCNRWKAKSMENYHIITLLERVGPIKLMIKTCNYQRISKYISKYQLTNARSKFNTNKQSNYGN